jgi:hypothetical protein
LSTQLADVVPEFEICAAQLPVCPPATLASETFGSDPEVFQPVRLTSNPGLPAKFVCSGVPGEWRLFTVRPA